MPKVEKQVKYFYLHSSHDQISLVVLQRLGNKVIGVLLFCLQDMISYEKMPPLTIRMVRFFSVCLCGVLFAYQFILLAGRQSVSNSEGEIERSA